MSVTLIISLLKTHSSEASTYYKLWISANEKKNNF